MTPEEQSELAYALALVIRDANDDKARVAALKQVERVVRRVEDAAFKRGYQKRKDEILANLREAQAVWDNT